MIPHKKYLYGILALALALRLALFYTALGSPSRFFKPDSYGYDKMAMNILTYRTFSTLAGSPPKPDCIRTPVYPLFLSGIYSIFGHRPEIAVFLQILLSGLTLVLLYGIVTMLFAHPGAALAASLLYALEPASAILPNYILTETLFTFLVLLAFYFLIRWIKENKSGDAAISLVAMSLAALTRPIFTFYPPIVFIFLFLVFLGRGSKGRKNMRLVGIAVLCYTAIVGTWVLRNFLVTGEVTISTVADPLEFGFATNMVTVSEGVPRKTAEEKLLRECPGFPKATRFYLQSAKAQNELLRACGKWYIKNSGAGFIWRSVKSVPDPLLPRADMFSILMYGRNPEIGFKALFAARRPATYAAEYLYLAAALVFLTAVYLFAAAGAARLLLPSGRDPRSIPLRGLSQEAHRKGNSVAIFLICLFIAYYLACSALMYEERNRVPVFPFIALLAAYGIVPLKTGPLKQP